MPIPGMEYLYSHVLWWRQTIKLQHSKAWASKRTCFANITSLTHCHYEQRMLSLMLKHKRNLLSWVYLSHCKGQGGGLTLELWICTFDEGNGYRTVPYIGYNWAGTSLSVGFCIPKPSSQILLPPSLLCPCFFQVQSALFLISLPLFHYHSFSFSLLLPYLPSFLLLPVYFLRFPVFSIFSKLGLLPSIPLVPLVHYHLSFSNSHCIVTQI